MIDFNEGTLVLLDKPMGKTSFQAVRFVKNVTKARKVGHAGTLDPLATGLLILCTGKWTKKINDIQGQEKEYTGTFYVGATRPSYDMETEVDQTFDISGITETDILQAAVKFTGTIEQVPPVYSAIKQDGKRAYESARAGVELILKPRQVEVREFEITRVDLPEVDFRIVCSKGTYIRTMASDFGKALGAGAYLSALRRTRIGNHRIEEAHSYESYREWHRSVTDLPNRQESE